MTLLSGQGKNRSIFPPKLSSRRKDVQDTRQGFPSSRFCFYDQKILSSSTTPFLAIVGPTASGKTERGLSLAKEQNGESISVDSRQIYRRLRVGTAKPKGTWTVHRAPCTDVSEHRARTTEHDSSYMVDGIPYHLVDFLEPDQIFSAADFVRLAHEKLAEIKARGRIPIFVGGTGLYFKALTEGLAKLPPADPRVRIRLKKEAEENGRESLHKRLWTIDPISAGRIPANNIQRLVRALEVYELTGTPISKWHEDHQKKKAPSPTPSPPEGARGNILGPVPLSFVGIDLPREELHRRIEARCRDMMEEGIIQETRALLEQGFAETCPALSGLGYLRVVSYLKGKISKDECLRLLTQDTRQYAKRQMTYFRHQLPVTWNRP